MKALESLVCRIPSNINSVCRAVRDILCYLEDSFGKIEETNLFEFKVVLNELILNAVKHGNKEDNDKYVNIKIKMSSNEFAVICVEDEGIGYNYEDIFSNCEKECQQDKDPFEMKECGRGIIIVKQLCNQVKFNKSGNKIYIKKKLQKL